MPRGRGAVKPDDHGERPAGPAVLQADGAVRPSSDEVDEAVSRWRVAAVQMRSDDGQIDRNVDRAARLVTRAVDDGARLIVLPELMPTGFRMTEQIWDAAEPSEGRTVQWLLSIAREDVRFS